MYKKILVAAVCGSVMSVPLASSAHDDADPVISYRHKVMASIAANIGAISDILKHQLPHQDNVEAHARQMNQAASLVPSAFEQELTEGMTDAKPEIWQDWDTFVQYSEDMERATAELAEIAAGGDIGEIAAQVKNVGDTCKQCHDDFRKPKEESYKNRM